MPAFVHMQMLEKGIGWPLYHSSESSFKIGPFDEPGAGLVNVTEIRPPFTPHRLGVQAM